MQSSSTFNTSSLIGALCSILLVATTSYAASERTLPRTPDGQPDLQGIWTGGTLTAFERPLQLGDKSHFTAAEIAEQQRQATERYWAGGHRSDDVGRDNDAFIDNDMKVLSTGQTSLVVFPGDGRYPISPEGEKRRDLNLLSVDTYETMSQWDRCITREPTTLIPVIYNNAYQIVQTQTHVLIVAEMIHDARVIPLGGKHVDARVHSWGGDSRGRWDGSTLVVETKNYNGAGWIVTGLNAGRLRAVPFTKDLQIIERFTRVDQHTLNYEITVDDPAMYTSKWTMTYPLQRDDEYRMYEYACHEGNAAVELILRGARVQEAAGK